LYDLRTIFTRNPLVIVKILSMESDLGFKDILPRINISYFHRVLTRATRFALDTFPGFSTARPGTSGGMSKISEKRTARDDGEVILVPAVIVTPENVNSFAF
jgi:hypothetical protein